MNADNPAYTETCPRCQGEIKVLYAARGVWSCSKCKIKITQSREEGIKKIEPLMTFSVPEWSSNL